MKVSESIAMCVLVKVREFVFGTYVCMCLCVCVVLVSVKWTPPGFLFFQLD